MNRKIRGNAAAVPFIQGPADKERGDGGSPSGGEKNRGSREPRQTTAMKRSRGGRGGLAE